MTADPVAGRDMIIVGRILGAHGVRGWMHVRSYTDPPSNLCHYRPLWRKSAAGWQRLDVPQIKDESRPGKPRLLLRLEDIDDRNAAQQLQGTDLAIDAGDLPPAETGSYYWRELIGLIAKAPEGEVLGRVSDLLETPAHPVLVVQLRPELQRRLQQQSHETLVPFVREFTQDIDLEAGTIVIDWPEVFFPSAPEGG